MKKIYMCTLLLMGAAAFVQPSKALGYDDYKDEVQRQRMLREIQRNMDQLEKIPNEESEPVPPQEVPSPPAYEPEGGLQWEIEYPEQQKTPYVDYDAQRRAAREARREAIRQQRQAQRRSQY